ncbi:MAG: efflux RND transporter periplasmic adaptor subunit [bacterium]
MNPLSLVLVAAAGLIGYGTFSQAATPSVVSVEASDQAQFSTISGTVVPYKEVQLTAQVPGRVKMVAGEEGTYVKQGGVLVGINDDDLRAKRQAAQAQLANVQSALQNAQVQYSRELYSPRSESVSSMPGMGMPSMFDNIFTKKMGDSMGYGDSDLERHADLYSAMTGVNQARAQLSQVESQIRELDTHIRDAVSIAPFDGVILKKMVEQGTPVQPGQSLLTFGHVKYLRLQAEVPARLVANLKVGMMVTAKLDNGVRTEARVAQIYPMADAVNHTVTVKFDLPQNINATPGMYAEISAPSGMVSGGQKLVIPKAALISGRSLPSVLVVGADGKSSLRLVRLGSDLGDDRVSVISGLSAGDRVVNHPPVGVKSGWLPGQESGQDKH